MTLSPGSRHTADRGRADYLHHGCGPGWTGGTVITPQMMTERELDNGVRAICRDLRLHRYHTWDSRKSDSGFPDLVIAGLGGVLFRELKRESATPTIRQQQWLDILAAGGMDIGVWRPSDLLSRRIHRELMAIAKRWVTPKAPAAGGRGRTTAAGKATP